jgi:hypothetical protein
MNMFKEATARPWMVGRVDNHGAEIIAEKGIWGLSGVRCPPAYNGSGTKFGPSVLITPEQAHANAQLIVHAVNNIERLTKERDALKEAVSSVLRCNDYAYNGRITSEFKDVLDGLTKTLTTLQSEPKE